MHSYALHAFPATDFDYDFVAIVCMNAACMKSTTGNPNRARFIGAVLVNVGSNYSNTVKS